LATGKRYTASGARIAMAIEDKLATTRFTVDIEPHIRIRIDICETCLEKPCLYICPVKNYVIEEDKLVFSWQGCVECGACRIACPHDAIEWAYPRGGFGVHLRYG
jgi:ferredoxin like protein